MSAQAEEGTLRRMTLGEIAMARRVFGDSIVYSRVWIHCDSYLPFGLQKQNYAMTPNGGKRRLSTVWSRIQDPVT